MSEGERRTWLDLRERLSELADLGNELRENMEWGQARFLYALTAMLAADAARLAWDLEIELLTLAAENGVQLPPLDLGNRS